MPRLDVDRFLEDLSGRYAKAYAAEIEAMLVAIATGNRLALLDARVRMQKVVDETVGVGEVLGASLVLQDAARILDATERFAAEPAQTVIPRVTLLEAVEDMVARVPVTLRAAAERTAQRIAQLYSEGHVTAFVRAAEAAVTHRAQALIRTAIEEGIPEANIGRQIVESVDEVRKRGRAWTEGYARMAFRTNLNTAVTAGRFRQVQDKDIRQVIPAFRFDAVGDDDTRDNHAAADGMLLAVDNPAWQTLAPPLGYNCRCQVSLVSVPQLRRMGRLAPDGQVIESRVPRGAFPDPGFRHGGRPDLMLAAT